MPDPKEEAKANLLAALEAAKQAGILKHRVDRLTEKVYSEEEGESRVQFWHTWLRGN